jgi:hypothetical protein
MNRKTSPYLGVLNEKRALKEPVGTFYHPSANHYRTGQCPVGKIERTGYEFKKNNGKVVNVKTTCVKDVGSNGKTSTELANKLKVNPKELESYGYSTKLETDVRHKALLKAIKAISYATTKRVLVLLRTQHKAQESNATIKIYNIYDSDIKWLTNYVEKKRSTSHNKDLFKKKSVGGASASGASASGANNNLTFLRSMPNILYDIIKEKDLNTKMIETKLNKVGVIIYIKFTINGNKYSLNFYKKQCTILADKYVKNKNNKYINVFDLLLSIDIDDNQDVSIQSIIKFLDDLEEGIIPNKIERFYSSKKIKSD